MGRPEESLPHDVVHQGFRGLERAGSVEQNKDLSTHLKGTDHGDDQQEEDLGRQQWHGNLPPHLVKIGVSLGSLGCFG